LRSALLRTRKRGLGITLVFSDPCDLRFSATRMVWVGVSGVVFKDNGWKVLSDCTLELPVQSSSELLPFMMSYLSYALQSIRDQSVEKILEG